MRLAFTSWRSRHCTISRRPSRRRREPISRLRRVSGPEALPDWCWERLAFYDDSFSRVLKHDLLIEGRVILSK